LRNAARQLVIGGAWCQARLHEIGAVEEARCQACGADAGTEHHRYWKCPAARQQRLLVEDTRWQHVAEQADGPADTLWTRALVAHPEGSWSFAPAPDIQEWQLAEGAAPLFEGEVFLDGSLTGAGLAARTGWAAVQLQEQGAVECATWGPMPCAIPEQRTIKRAELWALRQALAHAGAGALVLHTDHEGLVTALERGRAWCTGARRPHADVWREVWRLLEDMGGLGDHLGVRHVRAHRAKAAIQKLEEAERRAAEGNAVADGLAKAGAELDGGWGRSQALAERSEQVRWSLRWLANFHVWWGQQEVQDATRQPREDRREQPLRPPAPAPPAPLCMVPHRLRVGAGGGVYCETCGRAATRQRQDELARSWCTLEVPLQREGAAAAAQQNGAMVTLRGHQLMRLEAFWWCLRCGAYGRARFQKLLEPCSGQARNPSRLYRLRRGQHPDFPRWWLGEPRRATWEEWVEAAAQASEVRRRHGELAAVAHLGPQPGEPGAPGGRPLPTAVDEEGYEAGEQVRVVGLVARADLNGRTATVLEATPGTAERVAVRLRGRGGGEAVNARPGCLARLGGHAGRQRA